MTSEQQRPLFCPDFLILPYQLITDRELEQTDRVLYGLIYWYEHMKDGKCTASNQTLAALLFTTTRVVQNSLNALEKSGYITRDYKDESKRNRKAIHCMIAFSRVSSTGDRRKSNDLQDIRERPVGDRRERPVGDQSNNTNINNNQRDTPRSAEDEKRVADVIDAFKTVNPSYKLFFNRKPQREAAWRLIEQHTFEKVLGMVKYLEHSNGIKYAPTIISPSQLESKMGELKAWADKQRNGGGGKGKKIMSAADLTKTT